MKKTLLIIAAIALMATACTNNAGKEEQSLPQEQTAGKVMKYDLEHHFYLPEFIDHLKTRTEVPYIDTVTNIFWMREGIEWHISMENCDILPGADKSKTILDYLAVPIEDHIKDMDEKGVDVAVLSHSPGIEDLPREEAIYFARKTNDVVAEMMKKYPGRIMGTATLPTPYVDDAIAELERCINELGFKYWHTHSNFIDEHLYDEKFEPLLAKAEELGCAIYLHPALPNNADMKDLGYQYPAAGLGFGQDVMKTAVRLVMDGVFDRHPNLKIIIGHLGEYIPFTLIRLDNRLRCFPEPSIKMQHNFSDYIKNGNLLVTTSGNTSEEAFECAMKVLGIDNIMFGSDYGYEDFNEQVNFVKNLNISQEDKDKIFGGNFERIFLK